MKNLAILFALNLLITLPAFAEKSPPDTTLTGHTGTALDLAFSPDGRRLASVGDDGKLKIWDLAAKKELFSLDGFHGNINRVRYTPDGKRLVSLSSDNTVAIIDAEAGKLLTPIVLPSSKGTASSVNLSPDGNFVAVAGRGWLRVYDLSAGGIKAEWEVHRSHDIPAVTFSPDSKGVATVGSDHIATLLDMTNGKIVRTFDLRLNGMAVAFSADAKTLFVTCSDQTLQSFDIATGAAKMLIDKNVPLLSLAVSADGKTLVLGGPGHAPWLVSLPDGALLDPTMNADNWVKSAAISPDGNWLAGGGNGGDIYLWKTGK